jgi:hypothetical protein
VAPFGAGEHASTGCTIKAARHFRRELVMQSRGRGDKTLVFVSATSYSARCGRALPRENPSPTAPASPAKEDAMEFEIQQRNDEAAETWWIVV